MATAQIAIPKKLIPVFQGRADVRGAYGGRGSAKTRSFALMSAVRGYMYGMQGVKGFIVCGRQHLNSLDESSLEECKRAIESVPWLLDYYEIGDKYIRSKDGRIAYAFVGLDRNVGSIKSKGRILILWVDEAEPVSSQAWTDVIPTLREEDSDWNAELWVTWNPKKKSAPVETLFRGSSDPLVKVVELNYTDNPKFPAKLERERARCLETTPEQYDHIWLGHYVTALTGAYYAPALTKAKQEGRVKPSVYRDPLMTLRAAWDIGGTGAKADACAIWIFQLVAGEIRFLDYHEAVGQELSYHVQWLRSHGYESALCHLPHDGRQNDKVFAVSYQSALQDAGFGVEVMPNQGAGAAMARIECARRMFPSMVFHSERCQGGIDAVGWYHEKWDEERNIGLGPEHDWSSHGADAFGLAALVAEQQKDSKWAPLNYPSLNVA